MDLNCFKKKSDLFSCFDFRRDVFKARTLPQYLVFPVFFFFFLNLQVLHLYLLVSILPCFTSSLLKWQIMFYFHLSISSLEYLALSNSIPEFVFTIYGSFLIYNVPQMQLRFPGTLMQNKVFIISHSFL